MVLALIFALVSWLGTWASPPVSADRYATFAKGTLREVVHVSVGGALVRVRFTNRFGRSALVIGQATIALARSGTAAPAAGTLRVLSFGGSRSVSIPAGADVLSDAAVLSVPAGSNVAISLFVSNRSGYPTIHPSAYTTGYYASGNHASDSRAASFSDTFQSWFFIDAVEVSGTRARGALVTLGDSITDGQGSTMNGNDRWTDVLARRLLELQPNRRLSVLNAGIGGNRILLDGDRFGVSALARFDSDVLAQSGARDVMILLGINDIQQTPHQYDPSKIEFGLRQLALRAHARGLRAIGCTITPYGGWGSYDAAGEAARERVNEFIRHSGVFDAVVDFDEVVRDRRDPHRMRPAYDSGDHLHPNPTGYRMMGEAIPLNDF